MAQASREDSETKVNEKKAAESKDDSSSENQGNDSDHTRITPELKLAVLGPGGYRMGTSLGAT